MIDLPIQCAPNVAPETIYAIAEVESGLNPLAIGVNTKGVKARKVSTEEEAISEAKRLIQEGHNIDMGLMQINSANLGWLGISVEYIFDPCININAGGEILTNAYELASTNNYESGLPALEAALSVYNTGNLEKGFKNGYVEKYHKKFDIKSNLDEIYYAETSVKISYSNLTDDNEEKESASINILNIDKEEKQPNEEVNTDPFSAGTSVNLVQR